jgi:hypothetical protein
LFFTERRVKSDAASGSVIIDTGLMPAFRAAFV